MTEAHTLARSQTARELFSQWSTHWDLSRPVLMEKSPPTLLRTRLVQALFPGAFFIVIVRHPIAVALATYNALASCGWLEDTSVEDLVEHWVICHEIFQSDSAHLSRCSEIRYEDFVLAPQRTLDKLLAFLGLRPHTLPESIHPYSNGRYRAQWQAMMRDHRHAASIARSIELEQRVQALGYSLQDWATPDMGTHAGAVVLETGRLQLRHLTFDDVADLSAIYSDEEATRFLDGPLTREQIWGEVEHWIEEYEAAGFGYWAVVRRTDGRLIGRCGLERRVVNGRSEVELGYLIARESWGQGFGTEAIRAVRDLAFSRFPFDRLVARIDPGNGASIRVAEKSGFHHEQETEMGEHPLHIYVVNRAGR